MRQSKEKGLKEIMGYYYQSEKNNMVSDLYQKFGFTLKDTNGSNTNWSLNTSDYESKNKLIGINHG